MASRPYDPTAAGFDARYARWVAAQESGDEAEIKAAAADLPTLSARVWAKLAAVDETVTDPEDRAAQKRLVLLVSEIRAHEAVRQRERRKAARRRHDRTVRLSHTVELPTTCARCGNKLEEPKSTGRPRVYCSPACRKAAYEDRRAHRDGAVKVQVVEEVIAEIRERHIEVPHPHGDCLGRSWSTMSQCSQWWGRSRCLYGIAAEGPMTRINRCSGIYVARWMCFRMRSPDGQKRVCSWPSIDTSDVSGASHDRKTPALKCSLADGGDR